MENNEVEDKVNNIVAKSSEESYKESQEEIRNLNEIAGKGFKFASYKFIGLLIVIIVLVIIFLLSKVF